MIHLFLFVSRFKHALICCLLLAVLPGLAGQSPQLGAIRWDAWTGSENAVGAQVENTLGPSRFHYRVPYFGVEVDTGSVTIDGTFQEIVDEEIQYAYLGGLDYWAFVWYSSPSGLDEARNLYYSSQYKSLLDYCLIIEHSRFMNELSIDHVMEEFSDASYVRVMDGRPLLYFFGYQSIEVKDIDTLRARSLREGLGDPYIVELRQDGNMDVLDILHMDAFSMYAVSWIGEGVPYRDLVDAQVSQWNYVGKQLGYKIVPNVSTGWDKRPRHINNVSWEPDPGPDNWVQMPTPRELADNVQTAIDWIDTNPSIAESNTILIYAWNENDEGGWLCPTLSDYEGSARLDTLRKVLGIERKIDPVSKINPRVEVLCSRIYPNPVYAGDHLYIETTSISPMNFKLYSLSGRLLKEAYITNQSTMEMKGLENGIYPYNIISESGQFDSGKLLIY